MRPSRSRTCTRSRCHDLGLVAELWNRQARGLSVPRCLLMPRCMSDCHQQAAVHAFLNTNHHDYSSDKVVTDGGLNNSRLLRNMSVGNLPSSTAAKERQPIGFRYKSINIEDDLMDLKLFCINPPSVGGDFLEEATRRLYARIGAIITDSDLAPNVLPNSLNVSTEACLIFIVCTEDAMKTIRERLQGFGSLGDIRARVINDSLTAEDFSLYSAQTPKPVESNTPDPSDRFHFIPMPPRPPHILGRNEGRCICGTVSYLESPATECKTCKRLLLPRGVTQTARPNGDEREYVFFKSDGSILGTDKFEPGQKRHPWFG